MFHWAMAVGDASVEVLGRESVGIWSSESLEVITLMLIFLIGLRQQDQLSVKGALVWDKGA